MNNIKIIISYILIVLLLPIKVYASSGSFDGFALNGTYGENPSYEAYTYNNGDDSNLPTGFHYFYKLGSGKVIYMDRAQVITNILNKKVGVVLSPSRLLQFIGDYGSHIVGQNPNYYNELKPVLRQGDIVGVALNGLTGGVIESNSGNQQVSIPGTEVNNVYNYYNYWIEHDGFVMPDYITINGESGTWFGDRVNVRSNNYQDWVNALNACTIGFSTSQYSYVDYNKTQNVVDCTNNGKIAVPSENSYITGLTSNFCASVGLTANNDTISYGQLLYKEFSNLTLTPYDKETKQRGSYTIVGFNGNDSTGYTSLPVSAASSSSCPVIIGTITIWKDLQAPTNILNNTYEAPQYTTNNYKNYDTNNDNTYNTNTTQIDNSTTDNSNVYNEANTSNNTQIKNQVTDSHNTYSTVNQTQVITNTTTIVNNYYNTTYPSNPDNPDNPDNPSDGGGGLEDDSILDALLAAILKLLRAIGKIIATILTGIIDIITDVLEAIANITTSFTGIIEFIGNIFGFLPAECIAVLTLGLTISVLIALIKMFGK